VEISSSQGAVRNLVARVHEQRDRWEIPFLSSPPAPYLGHGSFALDL
jgi:hypothetical protein